MRLVWSPVLQAWEADVVRQILEQASEHDGVNAVGEPGRHALDGEPGYAHLLAWAGDTVAGYASLVEPRAGHDPMAEVVVAPAMRRQGIGRQMITAVFERGGPSTRLWAHGDLEAARAAAADLNLTVVRELLQLRRPLDEEFAVPDIPIRSYAGPSDDAELLRVNNAAFAWHPEQGGWTQREIDNRRESEWFDPGGLLIAPGPGDTIRGFHWTKRQPGSDLGEVYIVAVDPNQQGSGLGRALTSAGLNYLRNNGTKTVALYVEGNNRPALAVYRDLGFKKHAVDVAYATNGPS
ncbi:mycothiol synthase [Smaragdicoccus niigatensis]|uniref:mycothiol synthase n=1 Tax=Smaragdicoccus niigatensis TaxID=359359 RepID=UPI00035F4B62|nr:mycothiol synthase [Smaragdicoccus niigatensis]